MLKNIVPAQEWQAARAELLKQEKEATKLLSALATKRRELPMVEIEDPRRFTFLDSENKPLSLLDLFEGRQQLIIYHQMPFASNGDGCGGCAFFSDHIPTGPALDHLHSRDTTLAVTAPESPDRITAFTERMGWTFPFYSSRDTWSKADIAGDEVTWKPDDGSFKLNCFLKEGDKVYHTWETTSRGVEPVLSTYALLDMTKLGRRDEGATFRLNYQYQFAQG